MATTPGMTTRRGTKRNNSGDTIEVKQKTSTITISDNSENGTSGAKAVRSATRRSDPTIGSNRPRSKHGKAPIRGSLQDPISLVHPAANQGVFDRGPPVPGDDDWVEEYEFTSEEEIEEDGEENLEDDEEDAKSVISVSSQASQDSEYGLSERPWKNFSRKSREQWELMYATVTMYAINGNWDTTEDYQREKDLEMVRYMEDFPLAEWTIPREQANQAYFRLLERSRWRNIGIRIYAQKPAPGQIPPGNGGPPGNNVAVRNAQAPLNPPRDIYPGQRPFEPPRAGSGPPPPLPQQQMPMQQQGPPPGGLPPPPNALPSQPNAHPIPVPPGVIHSQYHPIPPPHGQPLGPPQTYHYGLQNGWPPGQIPHPNFSTPLEHPKPRKGKERRELTPQNSTPPPPPPTPPYPLRKKPVDKKPASNSKAGRKNARRQAEAEEFPWTRELNFREEKAKATWDDGVYDPQTLQAMEATRARNIAVIDDLDSKVQEQQRIARAAKKKTQKGPDSDDGDSKKEKKKREGRKGETGGDPYHSGAFAFASPEDEKFAAELGFKTPDEALEAGQDGELAPDKQAQIKICWNPGKKGTTENLEQVKFSVRDTLATRKQLEIRPILTKRAAECIVDFCPDMLWRGMLLRITSEAGYGNKDVRDRFCYNGCYCDKATITKRISAALGQKQIQPKSRGYLKGELEWYDKNVQDFTKYIDYFGKRSTHRNMLKIQMQNEKRKLKHQEQMEAATANGTAGGDSSDEQEATGKSRKDEDGDEIMDDDEDGHESEGSDDSNAVSAQDSDILDKMED